MSYHQTFLDEVEAFLSATGTDPSVLGREALGDPSFVFDIRKGRSPSGRTMDRVKQWMQSRVEAA